MDLNDETLSASVEAIWLGTGRTPPEGAERIRAAQVLRAAFAAGLSIPRQTDKTVAPMCGPRTDIG